MTTPASGGKTDSWLCQHTLPVQAMAAEALMLDPARIPAPMIAPARVLIIKFISLLLHDLFPALANPHEGLDVPPRSNLEPARPAGRSGQRPSLARHASI